MSLAIPVVWSDRHRLHEPSGEVWVGVRTPGTELPERAERIRAALASRGARLVEAEHSRRSRLLAVHDPELLDYLARAWEELGGARACRATRARTGSCPTSFPIPATLGPDPALPVPAAATARAG